MPEILRDRISRNSLIRIKNTSSKKYVPKPWENLCPLRTHLWNNLFQIQRIIYLAMSAIQWPIPYSTFKFQTRTTAERNVTFWIFEQSSERSGARQQWEQCQVSKRISRASSWASLWARLFEWVYEQEVERMAHYLRPVVLDRCKYHAMTSCS